MYKLYEWQLVKEKFLLHSSKFFYLLMRKVFNTKLIKFISFTYRVEKSSYFRREGADVHTDAEISISQAILGGSIRVQGVYEDHVVQVNKLFSFMLKNFKLIFNNFQFVQLDYGRYIISFESRAYK